MGEGVNLSDGQIGSRTQSERTRAASAGVADTLELDEDPATAPVRSRSTQMEPRTQAQSRAGAECSVLVVGGGLAGVASAVAAARQGADTVLVEKSFVPGGLATAGLITWYSPLCDGAGHQVTFGLAEELLRASIRYGPGWIQGGWDTADSEPTGRFDAHFQPASMVLALEEIMEDAGVDLRYDTLACQPAMRGNRVCGVDVEDRAGRERIAARAVVDATGDALIAYRAGAPCDQGPTQRLVAQIYEASLAGCREAACSGKGTGVRRLKVLERLAGGAISHGREYDVNRPTDATEFMLDSRCAIRHYYAGKQAELGAEGRHNLFPILLPSIPQVRMTRRIRAVQSLKWHEHGNEVKNPIGLTANWYAENKHEVWQVPYGALIPQGVEGLLCPGRNASSADRRAWDMLRIIHCCVLTGEVAGVAAALCTERDRLPGELEIADLHDRLDGLGIPYRFDQVF